MAKKEDRQIITLACTDCKARTYSIGATTPIGWS